MPNPNICGKLIPVKKGFGLKAKEGTPLNTRCAPPSADAVAGNSPLYPKLQRLGVYEASL
jgi:hypothetical protein